MKRLFYIILAAGVIFSSCSDDDSFSTSRANLLSFGCDTLSLDTVFSTVPTRTYSFWAYNNSSDGLRVSQVRLEHGNQTGFRVNVDGIYLDNSIGSQARDIEVRKGDSIRVFVELTSSVNGSDAPQLVDDNLAFRLESGVEQKVNLRAWSWDAVLYDSLIVNENTAISSTQPIVVRKGVRIGESATLTLSSPTVMCFGSTAGVDVYGRLNIEGDAETDVVLRGDRLDNMFDYLPYDRVSGQWRGIHIYPSSAGNTFRRLDLHGAVDAIVCDSAEMTGSPRLRLENVTIHNCSGAGLRAAHSNVAIVNTQISNTLGDCLSLRGGETDVAYSTLAQFYPFDSRRGAAVRLADAKATFRNTLVTGYDEDVFFSDSLDFMFDHCIVRTVIGDSAVIADNFPSSVIETPKDSVQGERHFRMVDIDNLVYDFRPDSVSTAIGRAQPIESVKFDRSGCPRSLSGPTIGCYEWIDGCQSPAAALIRAARRKK